MSSVQGLRKFISERLTAAAKEIFTELEKVLVQFEQELNHNRLLDGSWKPDQRHVWTEADQQLCDQEEPKHSQEESGCLQMKEEQEGPCRKQDGEQLVLKQERDQWQPQQKEGQIFCLNSPENIHQKGIMNVNSGSSPDQELKQNMSCPQTRDCSDHADVLKLEKHKQTNPGSLMRTFWVVGPELSQPYVWKKKDMKLCNQEWNSILNQKEPEYPQEETEPPEMKEEQEELCISQNEEQHVLKQETNVVLVTATYKEKDQSQPEPNMAQIVSQNSPKAQDQEQSISKDSGLMTDEKLKQKDKHPQTRDFSHVLDSAKLNSHNKTHKSEKWYTWAFSGKHISQSAQLTLRGEKSWSCQTCGKHFVQNAHLIRHMRIHTGEKPYSCKICGKSFSQSSNLTIHMRTHTGEKPFSCQTCGKHFTNRRNLKHHENAHRWEGVIL